MNDKLSWDGEPMSREALRDFIHAIEHHRPLREQAAACVSDQELIVLAQQYGYAVLNRDLLDDSEQSSMSSWFEASRINRSF